MNKKIKATAIMLWGLCLLDTGCSDMIADQEGDGGAVRPAVEIYTAAELDAVRNDLSGSYILMADIDLSGYAAGTGWVPIGTDTAPFTGALDGNGHTIGNLTIGYVMNARYQGLFGYIGSGGTVTNLDLAGATIYSDYYVGFLAGANYGTVSECHVTGTITLCDGWGGGLIGQNHGTVSRCYSSVDVTGINYIGSLIGDNYGTVSRCYATGAVKNFAQYGGGLVGRNYGTVSRCYAAGDVTGRATSYVAGGLAGGNMPGGSISDCYATGNASALNGVGGLVGSNSGTVSRCYALGSVSAVDSNVGGLIGNGNSVSACYYYQNPDNGYDTQVSSAAAMQLQGTYSGWDFTAVWGIDAAVNGGYPYLR